MADLSPTRTGILPHAPHQIFWEQFGDGSRPPVVLLNGLAMHTKAWVLVHRAPGGLRCGAGRLPGQGPPRLTTAR
jgi:pimeloyl-ACP methyl ester carboxylesterase